jgi:hypothetical protein
MESNCGGSFTDNFKMTQGTTACSAAEAALPSLSSTAEACKFTVLEPFHGLG